MSLSLGGGFMSLADRQSKYGANLYPASPSFTVASDWDTSGNTLTKTSSAAGFQTVRVEDVIAPSTRYRIDFDITVLTNAGTLFASLTDGGGGSGVFYVNGVELGVDSYTYEATSPAGGADLAFASNAWRGTIVVRAVREVLF